jgi:hypothetical protein
MFLLDRSGSMDLPFDTVQADGVTPNLSCYVDAGAGITCGDQTQTNPALLVPCTSTCPSRWSTVSTNATLFLNNNASLANYGVTFFPDVQGLSSPTYCEASAAVGVPFSGGGASAVAKAIASVGYASFANSPSDGQNGGVGGGTPTAASITWLASNGGFSQAAPNYILLMTDGLPNCDSNYPFGAPSSSFPSCLCVDPAGSMDCNYAFDCNDSSATATAILKANQNQGIKTIVLGYGDLNPNGVNAAQAVNSLNAMGTVGGFTRYCFDGGYGAWTLPDSGTDIGPCQEQFWRVSTSAGLAAALTSIGRVLPPSASPCQFILNPAPPNPATVAVDVSITNSQGKTVTSYPYSSGGWSISGSALTFGNNLCQQVQNPANAVSFLVRVLTTL